MALHRIILPLMQAMRLTWPAPAHPEHATLPSIARNTSQDQQPYEAGGAREVPTVPSPSASFRLRQPTAKHFVLDSSGWQSGAAHCARCGLLPQSTSRRRPLRACRRCVSRSLGVWQRRG